jgi:hypothetical protein
MKSLKDISAWKHEWLQQQFVITGASHNGWTVYSFGQKRKNVHVFKGAFLLKTIHFFRPIKSTRSMQTAQSFNRLTGSMVLLFIQWKYRTFLFRLIPASQAAFIDDFKSTSINSSFGIRSFEN